MNGIRLPSPRRARALLPASLLVPALVALASPPRAALAGGVNFNWGTLCYTDAPANVRTFACGSNAGSHAMTLSFRIDSEMTDMVGVEIEVEGVSDAPTLPDWWRLGSGGCRSDSLGYSGSDPRLVSENCGDWTGDAGYAVPVGYSWEGNRVHVSTGYAIAGSIPFVMPANAEFYAGTLTFTDGRTVGSGACAGCEIGMTWWVSRITVAGLAGRRDDLTQAVPGGNQFLYWNRSARVPTVLALVSAPLPSAYHSPVTLTATVSPPAAGGTVEFRESETTLGVAPVSGGTATLNVSALAEGDHPLLARFSGDGDLERALSAVMTHTVAARPPSTVELSAEPNPSSIKQNVLVRARVSPPGATGTLTFRDAERVLATMAVRGDTATLNTTALYFGAHALAAAYSGDDTHAPATSAPVAHTVLDSVTTTTSILVRPERGWPGQIWEVISYVTPNTATGSGVVLIDGATVATEPVATQIGQLGFRLEGLCGGQHTVQVRYNGDPHHRPSASPVLLHLVQALASTTTLTVSPNPANGQAVRFVAQIFDPWGVTCTKTGTVQFDVDGAPFGVPVPLVLATATLDGISGLPPGSHAIRATYSGCPSFTASTSPTVTLVTTSSSYLTLAMSPGPWCQGQPVSFTATLVGDPSAAGTVQFWVDGAPLGNPVALEGAAATLAWPAGLAPGQHQVRAVWTDGSRTCISPVLTPTVGASIATITGVTDVPHDQGGQVTVTWSPGCSENGLEAYGVLRQNASTLEWEPVASQPPLGLTVYSCLAATFADSVAGSIPYAFFLIESRWSDGARTYSAPDSGYSVDDLTPAAPSAFESYYDVGSNHLGWSAPRDVDVAGYRLYRSTQAQFVPGPENLLALPASTEYDDPGAGSGVHYRLCAVDAHGNRSGYVAPTERFADGVTGAPGGPAVFALERVGPNPSSGSRLGVAYTLPDAAPARLQVFDVGGRRIVDREVGFDDGSRHVIDLGGGFAPGLYLARLTQGAKVRVLRLAVLE